MNKRSVRTGQVAAALLLALLGLTTASSEASAQTNTGTIRGQVIDEAGAPVPAASVLAVNTETGAQRGAISRQDGRYQIVGLPPALYELRASHVGYAGQSEQVRVLVGQTATIDLQLTPEAIQLEGIRVVARRQVEMRTSEVATNVTEEQIRSLPQQDRNFLNFAALAPGVTASRTELRREITAAGLPASKINVFIDGTSFKNDVLEGGVHGQDASRGNPFPQVAVREFRVVSQNFKAEHQRAASAIVSAVTRSGTNEFEADGFVLFQDRGLVRPDAGAVLLCREAEARGDACAPEPEYERFQVGLGMGGPIIQDRLHFFAGYEGNIQNRESQVVLGRADEFRDRFGQYEGAFQQPFRSHLPFAKLSYQLAPNQSLELSYSGRFESDKRGFGGHDSFDRAEDVNIGYNVLTLQHSLSRGDWFNRAHVSAQRARWNPRALPGEHDVGLVYEGIINIGARSTEQRFIQDRLELRNDVTYTGFADHTVKAGVNVDFLNYEVSKLFEGNPQYFFRPENLEVPYRAVFGEGDPGMDESNVQFGAFLQTDWDVAPRLQLNLGVRWDAETNLFNNNWVTPDSIRQQLGAWAVPDSIQRVIGSDFPENYFTRGREDRPIFLGAFQPRIGFSYDVLGTGRTVLHGGFGIYHDREIWNRLIDERFRLQWRIRNFNFTTDPEAEPDHIPWQDQYLTREGLQQIISEGQYGIAGEVFLLHNDTRPPRTHQWSIGVRQSLGDITAGAAYRGVRGYNIFSWYCATPNPEHGFCWGEGGHQGVPNNYGLVLSTDEGRTWYDALDLTVERPYTEEERWGVSIAYTFADAHRKGLDFFTLDFPMVAPADWPKVRQRVERHRVIATGMVGLPQDFRLSSVIQVGSNIPFDRIDETAGWGPRRRVVHYAAERGRTFRQVDLRLQRDFWLMDGRRVGLLVEGINIFDHQNFRGFEPLQYFEGGVTNDRFRAPLPWEADTGRRLQIGLDFGF